jgi:hypothetical protein
MLTPKQAETLGKQLESLKCNDPESCVGLFTYVFSGEPKNDTRRFEKHLSKCEYCRVAFEVYRYKKDLAKLLGKR